MLCETALKEYFEVGVAGVITAGRHKILKRVVRLQRHNADWFWRFASAHRLYFWAMRIAKPILLVSTPVGVAFGLIEAWRVGAWLGTLMLVLLSALSGLAWLTVRRIRAERGVPSQQAKP